MKVIIGGVETETYPTALSDNLKIVQSGQTIQAVINSITDAAVDNPYTVLVPPGVYAGGIVIPAGIYLKGAGKDYTIIQGNVRLLNGSATGYLTVTDGIVSVVCGGTSCDFYDLKIIITGERTVGLDLEPFDDGTVLNCYNLEIFCGGAAGSTYGVEITGGDNSSVEYNFFNPNIVIERETWASGIHVNSIQNDTINLFGGRITTPDAANGADLYQGLINGTGSFNVYGTKYITSIGVIGGNSKVAGDLDVGGTIKAKFDEILQPASDTLTDPECKGTQISNYGQTAENNLQSLPAAAEGMNFTAQCGTAQAAHYFRFQAAANDKIYLDGVAGSDNGYVEIAAPVIGAAVRFYTFQTGVSTWDWAAVSVNGNWIAG